jgi:hypothetical protein
MIGEKSQNGEKSDLFIGVCLWSSGVRAICDPGSLSRNPYRLGDRFYFLSILEIIIIYLFIFTIILFIQEVNNHNSNKCNYYYEINDN